MRLRDATRSFNAAALAIVVLIASAVALRVFSPSDIDSRDQSRTIAYTVDMVVNGNFILAADTDGLPATTPPLVNYLMAPFVAAFGPQEWAFRLPALFAFIGTVVLIYLAARSTFAALPGRVSLLGLTQAQWAVLLSIGFYALSSVPLRHSFLARPDPVLAFGMMLAWYAATRALAERERPGAGWAAAFWLGTMIAALAKGPPALVPIVYAVLAARLLHDDWGRIRNLRPVSGLAVTLVVGLAWPVAVYVKEPEHFVRILLDEELGGHRMREWYSQFRMLVTVPLYLITRFLPWSLFGIAGAFVLPWRQWRSHALAPAILYLALLAVALMATGSIRGDRLASFIPLLAIVCAWGAAYEPRGERLLHVAVASLPIAVIGFGVYFYVISHHAVNGFGDNVVAFARDARAQTAGEPILFCPIDHLVIPVQPLFGINQRGNVPDRAPPGGAWVVGYAKPAHKAVLTSGPINGYLLDLYRAVPNAAICRDGA